MTDQQPGSPGRAMCARWTDHLRDGEVYGQGPHTAATATELAAAFPKRPHPNDPLWPGRQYGWPKPTAGTVSVDARG